MHIVTAIAFIVLCSFTVFLAVINTRNRKRHRQKVQLLHEIIISLTNNELSLNYKVRLSAEFDEKLKKGRVKLMHDINDLQQELFNIISQKK